MRLEVWLERILEELQRTRRRLLAAEAEYGLSEIAGTWTLRRRDAVRVAVAADLESTALRFAEAVNEVWGDVLGLGMPLAYYLEKVVRLAGWMGPIGLVVTSAENDPKAALRMVRVWEGVGDWTVFGAPSLADLPWPKGTAVLNRERLALTLEEARALAEGVLEDTEIEAIWRKSRGAVVPFKRRLYRKLGFPLDEDAPPVSSRALASLTERGLPHLALELAVRTHPERVPELVETGGRHLLEHGQSGKLWRLLEGLPEEVAEDERVVLMRLSAAVRLGRAGALEAEVRHYLKDRPAPEVRALAADLLLADELEREAEAERAARLAETSCTLFHLGHVRLDRRAREAEGPLASAVRLARELGRPHEVARNLWALAEARGRLGRYREAVRVLEEAMGVYTQAGLRDHPLWLLLAGSLAFYRAWGGGPWIAGVDQEEAEVLAQAGPATPFAARFFLGRGEQLLREGALAKALAAFRQAGAEMGASFAWVRAARVALELDLGEARRVLEEAAAALGAAHPHVALAQALVVRDPMGLRRSLAFFLERDQAREVAVAALSLAAVGEAPPDAAAFAWRALEAGAVARVGLPGVPLGALGLAGAGLHLDFLGGDGVFLEGRPLSLSLRQKEVLALLALFPKGLSGERLADLLYGERASLANLKPLISRLRKYVEIRSQPYRLEVETEADFLALKLALARGDAAAVAGLYRGPLLPASEAPGLAEERAALEEATVQLALEARHAALLWAAASAHPDRLEVWEALLADLSEGDPRRAWVRARVTLMRREYGLS